MRWRYPTLMGLGALMWLASCGVSTGSQEAGDLPVSDSLTGTSLYNLSSHWIAQDSTELQLGGLAGRPQVLAMIYTSCQAACPRIIADMRQIESELGADAEDVGFVLVSIDPEHDTPDRLDTFARENGFDPKRWTLLYGEAGDVLELAAVLGVNYKKVNPIDFAHSNIITVLDAVGNVAYQQEGLGTDPTATLEHIRQLVRPL